MDLFQVMHTFTAVVEAGSFVGAMNTTRLSKPAISRHINELEEHLGIRLLQRTTRRLSLTEEGRAYYQHCKKILISVLEMEAGINASVGLVQGRLRISTPQTFGVHYLAELWARFAKEYPQVTLDIELSDRVVDLIEENYDLAIRIAQLPDSSLISRTLSCTRLVLCASPEYLSRHGTPVHPHNLVQHDVISYSYLSSGDIWTFQGPDGAVAVRTRPRMYANNGDTCRTIALAHQGIILQPDFLVYKDLNSGALVELIPQFQAEKFNIYVVYPTRKKLPLRIRCLIDFLLDALHVVPWPAPLTTRKRSESDI